MYNFSASSALYRGLGLALCLLQLSLFSFGFPPFQFGIWVQIEPEQMMMFLYAYLACAWLVLGIAKGWLVSRTNVPLWWAMVAWLLWQLIPTAFASTPWRSWFGPPELGEGVAWHVSLLLMVMVFIPILQIEKYRRWIFYYAFFAVCFQALTHVINAMNGATDNMKFVTGVWVPTLLPKDLPFMVAYIWIAAMSWKQIKSRVGYAALVGFFLAILWISHNRTSEVLLLLMFIPTLMVPILVKRGYLRRFFYPWRMAAIVACFLPVAWVLFAVNFGTTQYWIYGDKAFEHSMDRQEGFSLANRDGNIGGRIPFLQASWQVIKHEPTRLIAGDGWGRFTDDVYKYALVDGVYVYRDGKRQPNWTVLEDVPIVHAHSQPVEALLSLGLPGMILWYVIPVLSLWYLPKRHFWPCAPLIVGVVMVSYFWFELVQDMPYRALALASLCCFSTGYTQRNLHSRQGVTLLMLAAACIAMGWSAWQQRCALMYTERIRVGLISTSYREFPFEWMTDDFKRGGDRLRELGLLQEIALAHTIVAQPPDDFDRGWYLLFIKAMHEYAISPHSNARAATTELWMSYKLFSELAVPNFLSLQLLVMPAVPKALLLIARKAPLRDDVAATYLLNLDKYNSGDVAKETTFLKELLSINPEHRGGLWTYGKMLSTTHGHEEEGKAMMRRAVAAGLEKVFPVTAEEVAPYK